MITDCETNIIYFSELLKLDQRFSETCYKITETLDNCQIKYQFLPKTKDIWARDYMPIQVSENKFIEYRYDPDYLQAIKYRKIKTYTDIVCEAINLKTIKTDIVLDGGNVVKSKNTVVLTDKAINENYNNNYTNDKLISILKNLFEVEKIIFIPWDKEEYFGHADGMLRFIDDENVVVNNYIDFCDITFKNTLLKTLEKNRIKYKLLKYKSPMEDNERNWAYINFLQTKDIVLLPKLGIEEDIQAFDQFSNLFPQYANNNKIFQIDASVLVAEGGAFNCISWTIKK